MDFSGFRDPERLETSARAPQARQTHPQVVYNRFPTSSRGLATPRFKNPKNPNFGTVLAAPHSSWPITKYSRYTEKALTKNFRESLGRPYPEWDRSHVHKILWCVWTPLWSYYIYYFTKYWFVRHDIPVSLCLGFREMTGGWDPTSVSLPTVLY